MRPSPHFLQVLNQLQMQMRHATASTGIGERRSRAKGAGIEFADYRSYQPGDDTRRLDARLHARLGDYFVREYEVLKQLPVTILLDGSRSMLQGQPEKLDVGRWLANALGYLALSSGDLVQLAFWSGRRLLMSPRFQGAGRADRLFDWVEHAEPDGNEPFDVALPELAAHLPASSLCIVLSDFWVEDAARALRPLTASGSELWAFHILTREERDPAALGAGESRVIDAESGEELLIALDPGTVARYREAFDRFTLALSDAIHLTLGQYTLVPAESDLEKLVLGLRSRGLLR